MCQHTYLLRWVALSTLAILSSLSGYAPSANAQSIDAKTLSEKVIDGRRMALVLGNAAYPSNAKLNGSAHDAHRVAGTLTGLGFKLYTDKPITNIKNRNDFERTVNGFANNLKSGDIVFIYYSGHAMQISGRNYLVPTQLKEHTPRNENRESFKSLPVHQDELFAMDYLWESLHRANAIELNIVVFDASRGHPFSLQIPHPCNNRSQDWLPLDVPPRNTWVAYSAAPGKMSSDNQSSSSQYTNALMMHFANPALELGDVFRRTRTTVSQITNGRQVPWRVRR